MATISLTWFEAIRESGLGRTVSWALQLGRSHFEDDILKLQSRVQPIRTDSAWTGWCDLSVFVPLSITVFVNIENDAGVCHESKHRLLQTPAEQLVLARKEGEFPPVL